MIQIPNINVKNFYKFDQSKFSEEKINYFNNKSNKNISQSVLYFKPKGFIKDNKIGRAHV